MTREIPQRLSSVEHRTQRSVAETREKPRSAIRDFARYRRYEGHIARELYAPSAVTRSAAPAQRGLIGSHFSFPESR